MLVWGEPVSFLKRANQSYIIMLRHMVGAHKELKDFYTITN